MPTITRLNLTMSRDTNGVVAVKVEYTLEFSAAELGANISFAERVALVRRSGQTDRYSVETPGAPPIVTPAPGDRADRVVAVLADAPVSIDTLGLPAGATAASRSVDRVLTAAELTVLLEVGREHPYVVVSVSPVDITADIKFASVEIDVGDPLSGEVFDVGGEPVGLAVDGEHLYVATKEGDVTIHDRNGNLIASSPVGGELTSIGFDGNNVWVTRRGTNTVTKLDRTGAIGGTFPTGGLSPMGIAFAPLRVWIANYGSNTLSMLDYDGALLGTRSTRSGPWAIAMVEITNPLVASLGAGVVTAFTSDGTMVANFPVGAQPWDISVKDGRAWVTSFQTNRVFVIDIVAGSTDSFEVGGGPKGIAAVGGVVFVVTSLSNELVKIRADDRTILSTYAVGDGPDCVVFDGDRVFVANRDSRNVSLIRVL